MSLTQKEIVQLGRGQKLKKKVIRGKGAGSATNLDLLAGAVAVICNQKADGVSSSQVFTILMEQKFYKKFGKNISRNMVSARMKKLWEVGHIQRKKEPIVRQGEEEGFRYIWYVGSEEMAPIGEDEKERIITGKFTRKKFNVMFRDAHSFRKSANAFEEAIFDIMSDNSDMQFPLDIASYKKQVAIAFTEELGREDRLNQLGSMCSMYCEITTVDVKQEVIDHARKYAATVWDFIEKQMTLEQKLAKSGMEFNQDEYNRLVAKNPDFYKSVKELKKEGKL